MTKRFLTLVTLLCWAGLLLYFWLGGRVAAYLHPQFHAWVAAAGFILLALAPLWWWASGRRAGCCGSCGCGAAEAEPGGRLGAGAALAFAVLLLPAGAAAVISPGEFGEAAVANRGMVTDVSQLPSVQFGTGRARGGAETDATEGIPDAADFEGDEGVEYFVRGPDGAIKLETIDLLYASEEPTLREQFENQRVAVTGQYVPPSGGGSGGFDLVRMFVICCAADARPLGISIVAPEAVEVPRMGWVRITGTARFEEKDGRVQPKLEAEKIERVEAPPEPFLY